MRIAFMHPRASDLGGVERQAHGLAVALCDAGHELHYFCQRCDGSVDPRIQLHRVPRPPPPLRAWRVWCFDVLARRAVAKAGPFDVVQGFGKTSCQDVYRDGSGCLADYQRYSIDSLPAAWRRVARRWSLHQWVVGRIEAQRYSPGRTRRIVAISELVRGQILQRYGLAPEDVEVLRPAVDLERFRPDASPEARAALRRELGLEPETPLIVHLGSDFRRKGLAALLAALAQLPGAHLVVLGRDRRDRRFRARARALGVAERCHFLGVRRDPERYLAAADCLAFPTHFDAFGVSVLEALACGVPAVVSRRAGAAEVIEPGKTGDVVASPEDPGALAAALRPFLGAHPRQEIRAAARREAERHGFEHQLEEMLRIYREVMDS